VEIEALDEGKEEQVLSRLERGAISAVFSRHFSAAQFDGVVARFEEGSMLEVGEGIPARTYARAFGELPELATALKKLIRSLRQALRRCPSRPNPQLQSDRRATVASLAETARLIFSAVSTLSAKIVGK